MDILKKIKDKLLEMYDAPLNSYNDFTFEASRYERLIASKLLIYIEALEGEEQKRD